MKRSQYTNRTKKGRAYKTESLRTFVALGLSTILPSLAFSAESDESIASLLAQAPSSPSDSKVKTVENHSSVVDLRSKTQDVQNITPIFIGTFSSNATLELTGGRVNSPVTIDEDLFSITTKNHAVVTINNTSNGFSSIWSGKDGIIAQAAPYYMRFAGDGHIYLNVNQTDMSDLDTLGAFFATWEGSMYYDRVLDITSNFTFKASGNLGAFVNINQSGYGNGTYVFNSPYIEIDMDNDGKNQNNKKYVIIHRSETQPNIYFNASLDNPQKAENTANILKLIGSINTGNSGNLYAYFTNYQSSLTGNLELKGGTSKVVFSDGSKMTGDIDITGNGNHSITFDNANFVGSIKNSSRNSNVVNASIVFSNTAGNTFGNGTDDIVASSYKGEIIGCFDVSANSTTIIKGGTSGDKGFAGSGTNTLIFDFKNNAKSDLSNYANKQFTISGGNTSSVYVMNAFQQDATTALDLSSLNSTNNTLYGKLKDAGINIANNIQGTLFFQQTNIQVGTDGEALFATKENIVGSNNDLNGLALGAMFGNATWNDANKDGAITADEIIANANGANYKLSKNGANIGSNITDNTSTGDIGYVNSDGASDNVKKQVAFIFTDETYDFGGNTQGYSGTIAGGTNDSKYYFANAGYINRIQIEDAKGDLILFNTAFRGDLGVQNKDVSIFLDFSDGKNGLRAEKGNDNANIVGAGSKSITFNFTGNILQEKYKGAVVGDATKDNTDPATNETPDNQTAKYTMLNLVKYSSNGVIAGDGSLSVSASRGAGKTLINALQESGLSNFDKTDGNGVNSKNYGPTSDNGDGTDITNLSTTNTILALRGTSLDATNIVFNNYVYDFAFGEGFENIEGVIVNDSTLKGDIDLSSNTNAGHKIILKGNALANKVTTIKFNATSGKENFGADKGGIFVYDDSTATQGNTTKTLQVLGLSDANKLTTGSELNITKTNFEGDIYADGNVSVNLDFSNSRTWKMDNSSFSATAEKNIIINGTIERLTQDNASAPTLTITQNSGIKLDNLELINTGATVTFTQSGDWNKETQIANSFSMRGTSIGGTDFKGRLTNENATMSFVFAKSDNGGLETTQTADGSSILITNKASGDGNYIAPSSSSITKFTIKAQLNLTFIGKDSHNFGTQNTIQTGSNLEKSVNLTFANAGSVDASNIKNLFNGNTDWGGNTITLQGTSLNGADLSGTRHNSNKYLYQMTFINDGDGNTSEYVDVDKYSEYATTNANGALAQEILKVQESTLSGALTFNANDNVQITFVGSGSHSFKNSNNNGGASNGTLSGGNSSSIISFRDVGDLYAGNGTSSIQNIAGTIAFDLTHNNENMQISGTLKNMLNGGKHQVQFAGRGDSVEPVTLNRLVFVKMSDLTTLSTSLGKFNNSATAGQYFNDADTFGNLSQADYSDLALLAEVNDNASSSLTLADNATVALTSGEVVFVGANSHKFDADSSDNPNKLGDSTGGTLTFVDAGTLKVDNLINESSSTQGGKGTINLIGSTKIESQSITQGGQSTPKNTLSLKKDSSTGAGITINAVFTASNALADNNEQAINTLSVASRAGTSTLTGASTYDIGQTEEQTIYHILFDYTSSNLTFGQHHAYTGNIYGLTSDSVIKFKNAGYIDGTQIENTDVTILVDNTQIRGDFRGDNAILDFRNGNSAITGNILTSDKSKETNLSQKILTFDLTGSTSNLGFSGAIQAGYKVAPDYTTKAQSILTFQNAPTLTLGSDHGSKTREIRITNSSVFIQSLVSDAGFSGIAEAITEEPTSVDLGKSYILKGTKFAFQGTSINASSLTNKTITENTYFLDLSFDTSDTRGSTGLGESLHKSVLTANSIVMGELTSNNNPLGLSLSFNNQGSLVGATKTSGEISFANVLDVKLKNNAVFNLKTTSDNGNIGTIVLGVNDGTGAAPVTATSLQLNAASSMNIGAGSMNFVGVFDTSKDTITNAGDYGSINVTFDGTNKAYGLIAHKGNTSITLTGDALFSEEEASTLGFEKGENQFADLIIDASVVDSGQTLSLNLAHTSGMVGIIGQNLIASGQTYTSLNLSQVTGDIALKGAFDLGGNNVNLGDNLTIYDNTIFKINSGKSITLSNTKATGAKILSLFVVGNQTKFGVNLTLTNLSQNITVKLTSPSGNATINDWGNNGTWNIRGTNIELATAFWAENNTNLKKFVFAKGNGTETTQTDLSDSTLKLSELTSNDKINESALSGNLVTASGGSGNGDNVKNVIIKNGEMTFIGKEALGVDGDKQKIDGTGGKIIFGFYNGIIKSGDLILDNTNNGAHSNLGANTAISDVATLRGTDTFNLSVSKATGTNGANNSTINAVFINGITQANNSDTSVTGVRYVNANYGNTALQTTLSQYVTSNAGGALSETQLKTLESKAYGNITLDNTVTATMKFIGENSHSFDGKTAIYKGVDDTYGTSDDEFYYSSNASSTTPTDWQKITINENGIVTLSNDNLNSISGVSTSNIALATLSGGNANSRFDFDHTSVSLDLIKNAGGKTYVYNSNVLGNIAVSGLSNSYDSDAKPNEITPSTTLFFNAVMGENGQELTNTAQVFIDTQFRDNLGINLDLSAARTLQDSHLDSAGNGETPNKLGATTKQTNLVLIGKGSVTANDAISSSEAIDLSFLPDTSNSANYAYTIISGGLIEATTLVNAGNDYEMDATIFGNSKVQLVDTYVTGERNFAQVGFINTNLTYNQKSSWGGESDIEQYLIFDMGSNANTLNKNGSTDVIVNKSSSSHYIFSNLSVKEITFSDSMKTTLNNAMDNIAPGSHKVIGDDVVGTLGLRGVSIKGNINESTNGVDIVFNSTSSTNASQGVVYKEWFNSDGSYQAEIVSGEKNLVSHGTDYTTDPNISGYAILMSSDKETKEVTISGSATKTIAFIGDKAVNGEVGGFENLSIDGGNIDSTYTFHTVGTLKNGFLTGVKLQKGDTDTTANLGTFKFVDSTIIGNINANTNTSDTNTNNEARLIFDNVAYSGEISGELIKDLKFAKGTDNVVIIGGSEHSVYDFSNLAGSSINLDIDMTTENNGKYIAPTITGFDGDVSLVGSVKLAKTSGGIQGGSDQLASFTFNNNTSWTLTDNSSLANLTLNNTGTNYNLDLASATRTSTTQSNESNDLRVLEVGILSGNGGQVLLGTSIDTNTQSNSKSDKIKVGNINSGTTLYITAQDTSIASGSFKTDGDNAIVLVTANTSYGEVKGSERKEGLSYVSTTLEHQITTDGDSENTWQTATDENLSNATSHRWVLSGFDSKVNQELVDESGFLVSNPYRMLMIETNNLNKRMGDLRDNDYNQGAWIRVFNGMDSGEGSKNLYTNIQLGYDYGTPAIGAKNYSGVAFSTSIVDISGNQYSGKANTYSLAAYNAYIADSGLYVDTIAKYLYSDQKITPSGSSDSSFGSHALSLGVEVGYRAYMGETNFYIEPQAEAIGGIIFGVKDIAMGNIGGRDVVGELKTTTTLNTRVGLVQGYSLKTQSGFRADFRVGVSLVNEFVSESDPVRLYDGITEASTKISDDIKAVVNVGTNLILTDQWRVYIEAEKSFGGVRNTDYQANVGARFSFGEKITSLPKVEKPLPLKLKSEENAPKEEVSEEEVSQEVQNTQEENQQAQENNQNAQE